MPFWGTTIAILCLALGATTVTVARRGEPGPKRHSLFETADGERSNPVSDLSAGAANREECVVCGARQDSVSAEFCVSWGSSAVGDD